MCVIIVYDYMSCMCNNNYSYLFQLSHDTFPLLNGGQCGLWLRCLCIDFPVAQFIVSFICISQIRGSV